MADEVPPNPWIHQGRFFPKNLRTIFGKIQATEFEQVVAGLVADGFGDSHQSHIAGVSTHFFARVGNPLPQNLQILGQSIWVQRCFKIRI
jgi:hypothetical protein